VVHGEDRRKTVTQIFRKRAMDVWTGFVNLANSPVTISFENDKENWNPRTRETENLKVYRLLKNYAPSSG
jgi:hypothetical protein